MQTLSTNFTESVCPLFEEYSRLAVTVDNHFDNDSLHTNLTLLVLISEKVLMDSCEFAVSSLSIDLASFLSNNAINNNIMYIIQNKENRNKPIIVVYNYISIPVERS